MLTRRSLLKTVGGSALAGASPAATRPNILILLTDDQRHDTIRALGNSEVRTPNMDRLAREGAAFTHASIMGGTVGAVCVPSRAMLLTGRTLFHVHDSIIDRKTGRERPFHLFPEELRKTGYTTHGIGKWHNGPALYARCFTSGENVFFGGMSDQNRVPVQDFDPSGEYPKARQHIGAKPSSELFSDSAVNFLKNYREDKPFCLYVAYTSPHDPRTAPEPYASLYKPEGVKLPKNFMPEHPFDNGEMKIRDEQLAPWPRTPEVVRKHIADYYAMVSHVDAQIGRVLDALRQTGREENTIVVFAGDNGLALGQHGLFGKQNVYEHSVRVPLILRGPGVPRARKCDSMVYLLDIYPTLCELAGITAPPTLEGASLVALLRDSKARIRDSSFHAYRNVQRAVCTERWKLIRYHVDGKQTKQLFDLKEDPWEMRNLAEDASQARRAGELDGLLREWMKKTGDPAAAQFEAPPAPALAARAE
ncbi:MAG: sulfatase-like hydrolase/transferase [Bryobacteraceae bacterium]